MAVVVDQALFLKGDWSLTKPMLTKGKMKAKKISTIYGKYSNTVTYEYRGFKYDVEYPNSPMYLCTSPKIQHKDEQNRIDRMIEESKKQKEYKEEYTAQYAFDLLWDFFNQQ